MTLRIARVVPSLPPMDRAYGYYVTFHMLTKAQEELGDEVTFFCHSPPNAAGQQGFEAGFPLSSPMLGDFYLGAQLARVVQGFDIIHAHARSGLPYGLLRQDGPPLIVHLHGLPYSVTDPFNSAHGLSRLRHSGDLKAYLSYRAMIGRADHVVCYCRGLAKRVVQVFKLDPGRVSYVDNGIEPALFSGRNSAREELNLGDEPVLIYVGRFSAIKGVYQLLEAMPKLLARLPELKIIFLGCPKQSLEYLVSRFPQNILVVPHVHHSRISAYYRAADAHIAITLIYGYQKTVLESLASGVPVVASDNPDNRRIIGNAGVYVDPLNIDEIVSGIETVMEYPRYRHNARRAPSTILARFTWASTAEKIQRIYDMVR